MAGPAQVQPSQRIALRQTQSLQLTPALQQAIKLLQLSATDLDAVVREALESNPFLLQETETEPAPETREAQPAKKPGNFKGRTGPDPALSRMLGARLGGRRAAARPERDGDLTDDTGERGTLHQHVERQIAMLFRDDEDRRIAEVLGGGLDDAGYLAEPLAECAARAGVPEARAEAILMRLQGMEPTGLFARDLKECLTLQLAERGELDGPMGALLDRLEMLAAGDLDRLAEACGVTNDRLSEMIGTLRSLDPRPGLAFAEGEAATLVPDLIARRTPDGTWAVEVNPDLMPRLFVDRDYYDTIRAEASGEDKGYLSEKMRAAHWLIRALEQRFETVLAVARTIAERQDAFLEEGVAALRPMTLRDVAESLEIHESTVSRAVAGKYIETPRGVLELRYFFSAAIPDAAGGAPHSARAAKARLRELIEAERKPLSDAALTRLMRAEGFDIARRTIAKYRESLGFPSSTGRRRRSG